MLNRMVPYSLYIHIPFCQKRCYYCDFNTYAGQANLIPSFVCALCAEIETVAKQAGEKLPVHTVYFGGGTPSLLTIDQLTRVIDSLKRSFQLLPDLEMTLEANPGTVSPLYLNDLVALGFNRISFGMQSADDDLLRLLGRIHTCKDVVQSIDWAKQAGFRNINLDLIFGVPTQNLAGWKVTLDAAIAQHLEHLSLYALTVDEGTPLYATINSGQLPPLDLDLAADMYEWAEQRLVGFGYQQYEISNWAKKRADGELAVCRHNLQYWRNLPYLGFGAGAHSYAGGWRLANVAGIQEYIDRLAAKPNFQFPYSPANMTQVKIDRRAEMQETMMVGLRLVQEGVSSSGFEQRFGVSLMQVFGHEIKELIDLGLLEWSGDGQEVIRLAPRGRLLGNQVFLRFVGEE
jgi:oxygen-independent coproporphyrinogen-3 oxidase